MTWLKSIIDDHEEKEAREKKQREESMAQAQKRRSESIAKWANWVSNVLDPVLADASKQLEASNYACKINGKKSSVVGEDAYTYEIIFEVAMGKSAPGFMPNKATITFTHGQDGITISEISSKGPGPKSTMGITDNRILVQSKIQDFLKRTWL